MGEKEIRPAGAGHAVTPVPAQPPPRTTEKPGSGAPAGDDPNTPASKEEFEKQVADAAAAAKSGVGETLYKDGWTEAKDPDGTRSVRDPQGVRGNWDPANKRFVDPATGKPFPSDWGANHRP